MRLGHRRQRERRLDVRALELAGGRRSSVGQFRLALFGVVAVDEEAPAIDPQAARIADDRGQGLLARRLVAREPQGLADQAVRGRRRRGALPDGLGPPLGHGEHRAPAVDRVLGGHLGPDVGQRRVRALDHTAGAALDGHADAGPPDGHVEVGLGERHRDAVELALLLAQPVRVALLARLGVRDRLVEAVERRAGDLEYPGLRAHVLDGGAARALLAGKPALVRVEDVADRAVVSVATCALRSSR